MSYLKEHDIHGFYIYDYITITSYLGTIEVEICSICNYLQVRCTHTKNIWTSEEGETFTVREVITLPKNMQDEHLSLLCQLCGADGT